MASGRDLRKRIKSVTNTQQITKAMKMVASARLRRAQSKAAATGPYADKLGQILRHICRSIPESFSSPLLDVRPVKRTAYIMIGADKGLAGAFSTNITKFMMEQIADNAPSEYVIITSGRKPRDCMKIRGYHVEISYAGYSDKPMYEHARTLIQAVLPLFVKGEIDRVVMIYTYFVNSMTQTVVAHQLLPIETPKSDEGNDDFIFMPDATTVWEHLLPKYVEMSVYNGLLQSAASELGARMTAMTSATDNAGELIEKLGLEYNQLRQSSITNEISEIVGGANALQ